MYVHHGGLHLIVLGVWLPAWRRGGDVTQEDRETASTLSLPLEPHGVPTQQSIQEQTRLLHIPYNHRLGV
jgi:hypothetical protein